MPTRNVVITERQAAFIEQLVGNGEYQNASEVLREGLRLVEERRAEYTARLDALRAAAQVGVDDMDAGRYTTFASAKDLADDLRAEAARIIAATEQEASA